MILDIVTPERRLKSLSNTDVDLPCEVKRVSVPGKEGLFEVLPGHAPFLTLLGTGILAFETDSRRVELMVSGGFCDVDRDNVTVMCEQAALPEEIDRAVEQGAHTKAQQALAALGPVSATSPDFLRLKAETERAASKLTLMR